MTTVSYPGVYIEEISSGSRPISAASTSTPAFVGLSERGPDDKALRITSWDLFVKNYGSFYPEEGHLAEAVYQFFNNGGKQCYIMRATRTHASVANVTVMNRASHEGITFSAANKGKWGNFLLLEIADGTDDRNNTFKLIIRKQVISDQIPALDKLDSLITLEEHDNLSMDKDSPNYVETVLERDSDVLRASVPANLTSSFQNGYHIGGYGPILNPTNRKFQISLDGDGFHEVTIPPTNHDNDPDQFKADIQTAVRGITPYRQSNSDAFQHFECTTGNDSATPPNKRLILKSGSRKRDSLVRIQKASSNDATGYLKIGGIDGASYDGMTLCRPVIHRAIQVGDAFVDTTIISGTPNLGSDGTDTVDADTFSRQFGCLDKITDFSLLAVPGIGTSEIFDAGVTYCENRPLRDVFYIGEMLEQNGLTEAEDFRLKQVTKPNSYGAVYFPWIKSIDLSGVTSMPKLYPPSGYIAGLYARIDTTRGVWKAPAGTEATISGAVDLDCNISDIEQGNLNKIGVNCLRRFDAAGIVSWGARTVTSDPEYLYIPVRRTVIMLKRSIYDGIQWAVFEPNDHRLWSSLRLNIESFMNSLFRAGAFQGETASDAYFVKCGLGDTMTQGDIDRGMVIVIVGFAPVKPAEFVIVRIQQKVGQQ